MVKVRTLWLAQGGHCYFCKCETHLKLKNQKRMTKTTATIEHLIPKSDGGPNRKINLKMACWECNNHRETMRADLWMRIASDPNRRAAFIAKKVAATIERRRLKKAKKVEKIKKGMIERFGYCYEIVKMSKTEFEQTFGVPA